MVVLYDAHAHLCTFKLATTESLDRVAPKLVIARGHVDTFTQGSVEVPVS